MEDLKLVAVLRLVRLDTILITFLGVFIPVLLKTNKFLFSLAHAAPILTCSACTFILNDIHDVEKDRVNHPRRPLVLNQLSIVLASSLYLIFLIFSILLITNIVSADVVFIYFVFLIAMINYDFIVKYHPKLKNVYVAFSSILPVVILWSICRDMKPYWEVASSLCIYIFCREFLMDFLDREGDGDTLVKCISEKFVCSIAFIGQFFACFALYFIAENGWLNIISAIVMSVYIISFLLWQFGCFKKSICFMKINLFFGIFFVV